VIGVDQGGEQATFRFFLNPGVSWLWVGGAVMGAGGLLAAWPTRRRVAAGKPPAARRSRRRQLAEAGRR
jgi:cytochrome c-type biogenesis protein CcmF